METQQLEQILSYYLRSLVPLIGDEVFFVKDENGNQPLRSYIVDYFFEKFSIILEREFDSKEKEKMKTEGYYGMSMLRRAFKDFEVHYPGIIERIKNKIYIHPSVSSYIQVVKPRLILTTSPFNLLDDHFRNYKSLWFYPDVEANFKDISTPTICHIFGKAGDCNVKWVIGEEELLYFLHAWNNGKSLDDNVIKKFEKQGLLVLGCNSFPDWIFRFLWYPLSNVNRGKGFLLGNKNEYKKEVKEPIDLKGQPPSSIIPINMSFDEFLKRINYEKSEDMYSLLENAVRLIKIDEGNEHSQIHDFFLSYASEDVNLAKILKKKLEEAGLDVWMDKERPKELDGRFWSGIEKAIANSRFFMPIVTNNYMGRFFNRDRIKNNKISALEEETSKIIDELRTRFNGDDDKMLEKIIPVLKTEEKVNVFSARKNQEIEIELNTENINCLSGLNPNLWIFNQIQFRFYSEKNVEKDTFINTDWSIYKEQ